MVQDIACLIANLPELRLTSSEQWSRWLRRLNTHLIVFPFFAPCQNCPEKVVPRSGIQPMVAASTFFLIGIGLSPNVVNGIIDRSVPGLCVT